MMLYCLKFQVFSLSWWILQLHELKWVELCTLLSNFACHSVDMRKICFDQIDSGECYWLPCCADLTLQGAGQVSSRIRGWCTICYRHYSCHDEHIGSSCQCWKGWEQERIICTGSWWCQICSNGCHQLHPFIQLAGMFLGFMKNIYFAVDTRFVSPTSFHALPSSIWSLFPYLLVYQFGILFSFRMPIEELWVNSSTLISFGCAGGRPGYLLGLTQANNGIWSMP